MSNLPGKFFNIQSLQKTWRGFFETVNCGKLKLPILPPEKARFQPMVCLEFSLRALSLKGERGEFCNWSTAVGTLDCH